MAHKPESFRLDGKKKQLIIYTNVEQTESERVLIEFYLKSGYAPMMEEKKEGITVDEMRKALKADEEKLNQFNELIGKKDFFGACKIYQSYMKANRNSQ